MNQFSKLWKTIKKNDKILMMNKEIKIMTKKELKIMYKQEFKIIINKDS